MIYIFGGAFDPPHVWHTAIVKSILAKKHPEKIIIIPSSERDDKRYSVSDEHRLAMLEIFVDEINKTLHGFLPSQEWRDRKVMIDDHFIRNWKGEMITKDVDIYAREKYGDDIVHIFWTDTIESMPSWDSEWYAASIVKKIFVPRHSNGIRHGEEWNDEAIQRENNKSFLWLDRHACSRVTERGKIENFEYFADSHFPNVSSTELRTIIPKYTDLKAYYEEEPRFIIPGLSKRISKYILEKRLYRNLLLEGGGIREANDGRSVLGKNQQKIQSSASTSSQQLLSQGAYQKPKVLVHVCCGPDVTMPIIALRDEYDIICFWYDPNIQPKEEHDKRYGAFVKVCEIENIPYIKWAYDVKHFFTRIKWLEFTPEKWEKCTNCYDMRMYVAAKLAKKLKIPFYTSSLNTSPKKDLEKLFQIGHDYAQKFGIEFLDIPFRKKWWFEKSVDYTREHDIYRQDYCGCVYSLRTDTKWGAVW
jgi:epoxyqueuosine reductase